MQLLCLPPVRALVRCRSLAGSWGQGLPSSCIVDRLRSKLRGSRGSPCWRLQRLQRGAWIHLHACTLAPAWGSVRACLFLFEARSSGAGVRYQRLPCGRLWGTARGCCACLPAHMAVFWHKSLTRRLPLSWVDRLEEKRVGSGGGSPNPRRAARLAVDKVRVVHLAFEMLQLG